MYFVILYFQTKVKLAFTCSIHKTHQEIFYKFLFLRRYFERLSVTGTNETKLQEVSWVLSFINIVIIVSCFIFHAFPYFSRTYFIQIVYFIASVISSFVKMMVNLCNPQNYIKFEFVFMFLWDSILWPLTNNKPSDCKKCYFLLTSFFSYCIDHSY